MFRIGWLLFVALLMAGAANGETVRVGDLAFDLPEVAGFCSLDRNHPIDRLFYEQQDRTQAQHNIVLLLATECRDIERLRQGSATMTHWAIWLLNAPNGVPARIPPSYSRNQILAALAKQMPVLDKEQLDAIVRDALKGEGVDIGPSALGVIDQDSFALYLGNVGEYAGFGVQMRVVGVVGMTPLARSVVTLNLYRVDEGGARFDELLAEVKRVVKLAVERSEAPTVP